VRRANDEVEPSLNLSPRAIDAEADWPERVCEVSDARSARAVRLLPYMSCGLCIISFDLSKISICQIGRRDCKPGPWKRLHLLAYLA